MSKTLERTTKYVAKAVEATPSTYPLGVTPDTMSIRLQFEIITPEEAEILLARNRSNRRMKDKLVKRYQHDMERGKWNGVTCEAICTDEEGDLLNGQNRLQAVVLAGTPQQFLRAYNVPRAAFKYMDTGGARTAGDILTIAGVKNGNTIGAMIRSYIVLQRGWVVSKKTRGEGVTNEEILAEYERRADWWNDTHDRVMKWYRAFYQTLKQSFIGGYYAHMHDTDPEDAVKFWDAVCTKSESTEHDNPLWLYSDRMKRDKLSSTKMQSVEMNALTVKAWNYMRDGRQLARLYFAADKEEFPTLK